MSRLLKGYQVRLADPVSFDENREAEPNHLDQISRVRWEARSLVKAAAEKARKITEEAEEKARQLEEEAFSQGFNKGRDEGFKQGLREGQKEGQSQAKKEMKKLVDQAHALLSAAVLEKERILRESESELVSLSLVIAGKVLARELTLDHSVVVDIVREAVSALPQSTAVTVWVNPDDIGLMKAALASGDESIRQDLDIKPDTSITPGGCRVSSKLGSVDSTLESRLAEICRELRGEVK